MRDVATLLTFSRNLVTLVDFLILPAPRALASPGSDAPNLDTARQTPAAAGSQSGGSTRHPARGSATGPLEPAFRLCVPGLPRL